MGRTTDAQLRAAFEDFRLAFARTGLRTSHRWYDHDTGESGEYLAGALDLVLTAPDAYRNGSISSEPWHNPLTPQRFPGASGSSEPAGGVRDLGGSRAECVRTLRTATAVLNALLDAGRPGREHYAPALAVDAAAVEYLEGVRQKRWDADEARAVAADKAAEAAGL